VSSSDGKILPSAFQRAADAVKFNEREEANPLRPKILLVVALARAFVIGTMANGICSAKTRTFSPAEK